MSRKLISEDERKFYEEKYNIDIKSVVGEFNVASIKEQLSRDTDAIFIPLGEFYLKNENIKNKIKRRR